MIFRSKKRKKVGPFMKSNINMFYAFGIKPQTLATWFGVSRSTVYRYIDR